MSCLSCPAATSAEPPSRLLLLQIWNLNSVTGVVGLFNVQASGRSIGRAAEAERVVVAGCVCTTCTLHYAHWSAATRLSSGQAWASVRI